MADMETIRALGIRRRADEGDASAQFDLGWCYELGKGVSEDDALPPSARVI